MKLYFKFLTLILAIIVSKKRYALILLFLTLLFSSGCSQNFSLGGVIEKSNIVQAVEETNLKGVHEKIWYKSDEVVPASKITYKGKQLDEKIELRTGHSKSYQLGDEKIMVITSGDAMYDDKGVWKAIKVSTTTKEDYNKIIKKISLFKGLIKKAEATTYNPSIWGVVRFYENGTSWEAVRNATSGTYTEANSFQGGASYNSGSTQREINRTIFRFDTSGIGAGSTVTKATTTLYGTEKGGSENCTYSIYGCATYTALENASYSKPTDTSLSDTTISQESFNSSGWNTFPGNAAALSNVNVTGYTYMSFREVAHDVANVQPGSSGTYAYGNNGSYLPTLTIAYTAAPTSETTIQDDMILFQ